MLLIALPMLVSNASEMLMIFVDRIFLSRLGSVYMNAAMGGGITCFMMITFFLGLCGYSTAIVAQYLGAGKKEKLTTVLVQACLIAVLAYPLVILARPLGHKYFDVMDIVNPQLSLQKTYFNVLVYTVIFSMLRNCLSSFFSGIGKTKIVMLGAVVAMLVNIFFNYVLIYGKFGFPALGITGAAVGTIIGGFSGFLVLLVGFFKLAKRYDYNFKGALCFESAIMKKLLRFGYPAGIEMFLNVLAFSIVVLIFQSHSPISATAASIVFNWDMVTFVPLIGVEIAVTSLFGRYMGAKEPDIAHKSAMSGLKIGWMYSAVIFSMFVFIPDVLAGVFRPDMSDGIYDKALPAAVFMIRAAALYVTVEAIFVVFIGALRGAGDTFWAMCLSVSLHWILVPILYVMLKVNNTAPQQAWLALVTVFAVFSILVYLRYRTGKWRSISIIDQSVSSVGIPHEDIL